MRPAIRQFGGVVWSLGIVALVVIGCGTEKANEAPEPTYDHREQASGIVEAFESSMGEHLKREVVRRAVAREIRKRLTMDEERAVMAGIRDAIEPTSGEGAGEPGDVSSSRSKPPRSSPPGPSGLARPEIVASVYERRGFRSIWLYRGAAEGGKSVGVELTELFEDAVKRDGLWPDALHVRLLRRQRGPRDGGRVSAERLHRQLQGAPSSLTENERAALTEAVARRISVKSAAKTQRDSQEVAVSMSEVARLAGKTEQSADGAVTPRLGEWVTRRVERRPERIQRMLEALAVRDIALTDAVTHYAGVMRWDYAAWYERDAWHQAWRQGDSGPLKTGWPMNFEPGESPPDEVQTGLDAARHRAALEGWVVSRLRKTRGDGRDGESAVGGDVGEDDRESGGGRTMVGRLEALRPTYPPYERLAEMFPAYRSVMQRGGWPEVPASVRGLGPGVVASGVATVKRRLAAEGYFPGREESPHGRYYSDALADAVRAYQSTHQLRRTGKIDPPTWRSLNVSAETRFHQMRVTLQRWRESRAVDQRHYIRVNVPGFHVAVWRDGERQMRFRTMVGQTTVNEDEESGERQWPHATPLFSDTLRYLVFNPYWNVPQSIRNAEIEPKLEENEDYLEEERIEKVTTPNGYTHLRQKPGPENALGRVKFLFPNDQSIYLHDTPHDEMFRRPFRALSHGCIRVESPMRLMNYLLDRDGRWDEEERLALMKEWYGKDSESWVRLQEPIPIHLEYYVVRADREGQVHFYSDLYDLNEERLAAVDRRLASLPTGQDVPGPGDEAWTRAALRGEQPSLVSMPVQFDPSTSSGPSPRLPERDRTVPEFLAEQTKKVLKKRKKRKDEETADGGDEQEGEGGTESEGAEGSEDSEEKEGITPGSDVPVAGSETGQSSVDRNGEVE